METDLLSSGPSFIMRVLIVLRCSPTFPQRALEFSGLIRITGWLHVLIWWALAPMDHGYQPQGVQVPRSSSSHRRNALAAEESSRSDG